MKYAPALNIRLQCFTPTKSENFIELHPNWPTELSENLDDAEVKRSDSLGRLQSKRAIRKSFQNGRSLRTPFRTKKAL